MCVCVCVCVCVDSCGQKLPSTYPLKGELDILVTGYSKFHCSAENTSHQLIHNLLSVFPSPSLKGSLRTPKMSKSF